MNLWTAEQIAKATGGTASGAWSASGISIDTRTLAQGELFVPLKDARDGHDFIDGAMAQGAAGTLSEIETEHPHVRVDDTLAALRAMGRARVMTSKALRIAVTGSVGKTSVKEALAVMFSRFGNTHKSLKSYNNHWGVPLTMARMPIEAEYGVFEMGMNHAGELEDLSTLAQPDIAIITTVAPAHLAHFESVEAIADAKAEIMMGLRAGGILILNADNPHTPRIRKLAEKRDLQIMTFGHDVDCDVCIVTSQSGTWGSNIRLRIASQQIDVTLPVPGAHWVSNAACCMAAAFAANLDLRKAAMGLRRVAQLAGRGEAVPLMINDKAVTLIDESYNANPESMRASIAALGLYPGRKIAVLGDMLELGEQELAMHAALKTPLGDANVDKVITCGERMTALSGATHTKTRGEALAALIEVVQEGDVILVKGSNASGMSNLVADLKAVSDGAPHAESKETHT